MLTKCGAVLLLSLVEATNFRAEAPLGISRVDAKPAQLSCAHNSTESTITVQIFLTRAIPG